MPLEKAFPTRKFAAFAVQAKAFSGGLMPVSAVLRIDKVYDSVYSSLGRAIVHPSTFSESGMSMRAGLATLDVREKENLGPKALGWVSDFAQSSERL